MEVKEKIEALKSLSVDQGTKASVFVPEICDILSTIAEKVFPPEPPLKMFEVWANEECTVRPVVGQEYTELYLQVNAQLNQQCPTPDYANNMDGASIEVCSEYYEIGDPISLRVFIDFMANIGTYEEGTDLSLPINVYKLEATQPVLIVEENEFSSGPDVE